MVGSTKANEITCASSLPHRRWRFFFFFFLFSILLLHWIWVSWSLTVYRSYRSEKKYKHACNARTCQFSIEPYTCIRCIVIGCTWEWPCIQLRQLVFDIFEFTTAAAANEIRKKIGNRIDRLRGDVRKICEATEG